MFLNRRKNRKCFSSLCFSYRKGDFCLYNASILVMGKMYKQNIIALVVLFSFFISVLIHNRYFICKNQNQIWDGVNKQLWIIILTIYLHSLPATEDDVASSPYTTGISESGSSCLLEILWQNPENIKVPENKTKTCTWKYKSGMIVNITDITTYLTAF